MKENFLNLYENNVDGLFEYCYQKTADRQLAKSITEEAFRKTWDSVTQGESLTESMAHVYEIAGLMVRNAVGTQDVTKKPQFISRPALKIS